MEKITVALAGNPNSGKTTVFNMLTGAHQHVGNYPGVTVEKKEGLCKYAGLEMTFVDLPGTYSLTAYSIEELVARNFIIEEQPGVVVDVIDASNIERNLYLATQLIEMNVPLVLAFNMSDIARRKGLLFNYRHSYRPGLSQP
ncbi:MAG: FeoB small GTPase domain-containing protein [Planctomycetota bacterium]|jgi:ferrous iron transport protein B